MSVSLHGFQDSIILFEWVRLDEIRDVSFPPTRLSSRRGATGLVKGRRSLDECSESFTFGMISRQGWRNFSVPENRNVRNLTPE